MIVKVFTCARCGRVIQPEKIHRVGTQLVTITDEHFFLIKHRFSGGEKDVHRWRSDLFCDKCTKKLEKAYQKFMGVKKKESKDV